MQKVIYINNQPTNYTITDDGLVRNTLTGRTIRPFNNGRGYYQVCLFLKDFRANVLVHRLVAEAFIPNPYHYEYINHKDECGANNRVENLEWCDRSYNINYGHRNQVVSQKLKGNKNATGHRSPRSYSKDNTYILCFNNDYKKFDNQKEIAKYLQCAQSAVSYACINHSIIKGYKIIVVKKSEEN